MRQFILILFLAASLQAADVTIAGTLVHPNGAKANCTITILGPSGMGTTGPDGQTITPGRFVYTVTNGVYSFKLASNIGMVPSGTSYRAQYQCRDGQAAYNETWVVPATGPVTIDQIRVNIIPAPNVKFNMSQLRTTGVANGVYCVVITGDAVSLTTCSGGNLFDLSAGLFDSATGLFDSH